MTTIKDSKDLKKPGQGTAVADKTRDETRRDHHQGGMGKDDLTGGTRDKRR
jgi:hypothetical protein